MDSINYDDVVTLLMPGTKKNTHPGCSRKGSDLHQGRPGPPVRSHHATRPADYEVCRHRGAPCAARFPKPLSHRRTQPPHIAKRQ
jgi:hypothetical protein